MCHPSGGDSIDVGSLAVVLHLLLLDVEGGDRAVPNIKLELVGALIHGQLSTGSHAVRELHVHLIDVGGGQHGIA